MKTIWTAFLTMLLGVLMTPHEARSQSAESVAAKLIGTWKLVSVVREEVPDGAKTDLMGPNPVGFITYGPEGADDGSHCTQFAQEACRRCTDTSRGARSGSQHGQLYRPYAINEGKVIHTVDISWNESWTGTKQIRNYKFEGDRLSLSTDVTPDPIDGKVSVRSLIWEKLK
jgi:hypothetical protein